MFAKDESASFYFEGVYTKVQEPELLEYTMTDDRKVKIIFAEVDGGVKITETFDPESENPLEFQQSGWQAFLDNFKNYVETS